MLITGKSFAAQAKIPACACLIRANGAQRLVYKKTRRPVAGSQRRRLLKAQRKLLRQLQKKRQAVSHNPQRLSRLNRQIDLTQKQITILTHCGNPPCLNGVKDGAEEGIDCGGGCPFECPTNWKSGISLSFQGTPGKDYAEEYFYFDKLIDDHRVVYIKESTPIVLEHNERNSTSTNGGSSTIIGRFGANGIPDNLEACLAAYPNIDADSCDDGIIRYRTDRDLQSKYFWGAAVSPLYPAYQGPLMLAALNYGPEDPQVPVLGTTGAKPGASIQDRYEYYRRGLLDSFGDEWHTLSYADDDVWQQTHYIEVDASDGKTALFVVNPKAALIYFEAKSEGAQFYTTPAKTNFIPVIHPQTTYLTDGVDINFVNIMNSKPVYYRLDDGNFIRYKNPLSSSQLAEGAHTLEYYYNSKQHKTRRIVKNPSYPSDADVFVHDGSRHGNLLWPNDQKLMALRQRLLSGSLAAGYAAMRDNHGQWGGTGWNIIDQVYRQGLRQGAEFALRNALVVAMEGAEARPEHAAYAKKALLDSQLNIDMVGSEVPTGQIPNPSRELFYHGYYAVDAVYDKALAYDLLIKYYRASEHAGGITPIEDYKLRDLLAAYNFEMMKWLGGFSCVADSPTSCASAPNLAPLDGMWDFAQYTGAVMAAMAMPAYDSAYFGTSGYDGAQASHLWAPYPDFPASWRDVFLTYTDQDDSAAKARVYGYPNQQRLFNHLNGGLITKETTPVNRRLTNGTLITEIAPGAFSDRISYYSYGLMGHTFQFLAIINKLKFNLTYPWLELSFEHANDGTLFGLKINDDGDLDPQHFWQYLLINEYFPNIAPGAEAYLPLSPEQRFQYLTSPYGLIWYNPDWNN